MKIGRKIYYEGLTGNVILETGERMGDVSETTAEQDFALYKALQVYVPEQVSVVQLEYGQDVDKFGLYNYSVDTANGQIVWGSLIEPVTLPTEPTITDQLAELKKQQLIIMDTLTTVYKAILAGDTTI